MLYQELLAFSEENLKEFFANVQTFDNQFSWSDFNEQCYKLMYEDNTYTDFKTVKELKTLIPELKETCSKCGKYFIPARNKSIPKYDVILGMQLENALMDFLASKLNTIVCRGDLKDRSLPDCRVLDKNGKTVAYFELKYHAAPFISALQMTGRYCYEGSATLDYKKIEKQLNLIEEINVPVFYVHWIDYPCIKGIFFETAEAVKKYIAEQHELFERKEREGDSDKSSKSRYLKKMYSPLLDMGTFEELLSIFEKLLKEGDK